MTAILADVMGAFAFLTILPLNITTGAQPGRIFAFFPLVGLAIGAVVAVVASICFLPPDLTAFLTLAVWVILTGGLHLDGFADSCDGLLATVTSERRLEIMKDPRAGSWAVIGLILLLLGKWSALQHVTPLALIMPPVVGRWAMVVAAANFPNARQSGMSAYFRTGLGRNQVIVASATALIVVLLSGWRAVLALALAFVLVTVGGRWAARQLGGGLTGDVYGALCELTELLCLLIMI